VKKEDDLEDVWIDKEQTVRVIEEYLSKLLEEIDFDSYTKKDIAELYENIALRKNVWLSFFNCHKIMQELDFGLLEESRF